MWRGAARARALAGGHWYAATLGTADCGALTVAFSDRIDRTRLSPGYRAGLALVALAMLLLPLLYLPLIALAGAGVWWHLTENTWLLETRGIGFLRLFAYLGPGIAGVVLIFFMVKPVLARPAERHDPVVLERQREPALFDFIDRIAEQVGAPAPGRVQVDCRVNASAGLAGGVPIVWRRGLVLTIGLPLAAGLTVRQLGGVLGHEFGHFAQGGGMRLTAMVRGINGWFWRVVYERDEWDEKLERWSQEADGRIALVLLVASAGVWCSRQVLTGLMMAGHVISCFMLRQMEYDADSYEMKIAGSDTFIQTFGRLRELNVGAQAAYGDLSHTSVGAALPAHLPSFVVERLGRVPADTLRDVRQLPAAETGLFDTHPSDADRIAAAERARCDGVMIGGDLPAAVLFRDFDALGAAATRHHYEHDLGLRLDDYQLVSTEHALREGRAVEDTGQALDDFFGPRLSTLRLIELPVDEAVAPAPDELVQQLREARTTMAAAGAALAQKYRLFESLERTKMHARWAEELMTAGVCLPEPDAFGLTEGTLEDARATLARAVEQQDLLVADLVAFEEAAGRRLTAGRRLLASLGAGTESDRARVNLDSSAAAALAAEAGPLVDTLRAFAAVWPAWQEFQILAVVIVSLGGNRDPDRDVIAIAGRLRTAEARRARLLREITERLRESACPPPLASQSLASAVGLEAASDLNVAEVGTRALSLYFRSLGRLARIVLQLEERIEA